MFEDLDDDFSEEQAGDDQKPPEESGNRNFLVAVGVLGGITVLAIICIIIYAAVIAPRGANLAAQQTQDAAALAQGTAVQIAAEGTSEALAILQTPSVTPTSPATNTPTVTATPVVVVGQETATEPVDPRTATVAALLTQAAQQPTALTPVGTITGLPTALPGTGFADDVGLPGLLALAFFSILVIFLARRLRAANG